MQVLKVKHIDFELTIECNNVETAFNKAKKKNPTIFSSTFYKASAGEISIYDFETKNLEQYNQSKTYPLIFENKEYFIGIEFNGDSKISLPKVYSKIKEFEEKFFFKEKLKLLAGTINYGNDIGKTEIVIQYQKENKPLEFTLQFEVFPTKLDYRNDYDKILRDIEREYSSLVLDYLKKTYTSFKSGNSKNTDLIWWQVFGGLYKDFLHATKFILNKPHSRIIKQTRFTKADKIIKWTPALEEEFIENRKIPNRNYRIEYKSLDTNSVENQFLKFALNQTWLRFKRVRSFVEQKFANTISASFKDELLSLDNQLKMFSNHPFFRSVGAFKGIKQESLVLQKATGYSTIYKSWIMLNSGLKFLDGIQKMELKNIADLYQIWCFLEMKNVLQNLLGKENPDEINLAEIQVDDFVFKIERGVKSKVSFKQNNGEIIELYHDLSFNINSDDVKSFTVTQRPDIVLRITKNDLKENYVLTYLYDAKYRLDSDERDGGIDFPPEDAINQMHRYRDSIFYYNRNSENPKPEKEVIGAYVLFPGTSDIDAVQNSVYFKSIAEVNVGAFPLSPNDYSNRELLKNHLTTILGLDTESVLNEVSPQKESMYESPNPEVLIGIVNKGNQTAYFENEEHLVYHTGKVKPSKLKDEDSGYVKIKSDIKFFAPYYSGKGIKEYFEILDYRIIPRNEIFPKGHLLNKESEYSDRLVIRLGKKFNIKNGQYFTCPITVYRYTKLSHLRNAKDGKIEAIKINI